jgi:hypothetical protein
MRYAWTMMILALASPALAQLDFSDDFEDPGGVYTGTWSTWPEADEKFFGDSRLDRNHTDLPEATWSARAEEADPWGYAMYADFGATEGPIYAEVWIYDEIDDDGTDPERPVSNMLALIAGNPIGDTQWNYTEYLQIGVNAWCDNPLGTGLTTYYSIRTQHRDTVNGGISCVRTRVPRKIGWTKLAIAADAVADGGQVRFYIDDVLVGVTERTGVAVPYVRLGLNFKSYDYFWYDDVLVTDVLPPDQCRFDTDNDGDVDQDDFASFQMCFTGSGGSYDGYLCGLMDADEDTDVDGEDQLAFEGCASGPDVPVDPTCDNPSSP